MKYTITLTPHHIPCPPEQRPMYEHALELIVQMLTKHLERTGKIKRADQTLKDQPCQKLPL